MKLTALLPFNRVAFSWAVSLPSFYVLADDVEPASWISLGAWACQRFFRPLQLFEMRPAKPAGGFRMVPVLIAEIVEPSRLVARPICSSEQPRDCAARIARRVAPPVFLPTLPFFAFAIKHLNIRIDKTLTLNRFAGQ